MRMFAGERLRHNDKEVVAEPVRPSGLGSDLDLDLDFNRWTRISTRIFEDIRTSGQTDRRRIKRRYARGTGKVKNLAVTKSHFSSVQRSSSDARPNSLDARVVSKTNKADWVIEIEQTLFSTPESILIFRSTSLGSDDIKTPSPSSYSSGLGTGSSTFVQPASLICVSGTWAKLNIGLKLIDHLLDYPRFHDVPETSDDGDVDDEDEDEDKDSSEPRYSFGESSSCSGSGSDSEDLEDMKPFGIRRSPVTSEKKTLRSISMADRVNKIFMDLLNLVERLIDNGESRDLVEVQADRQTKTIGSRARQRRDTSSSGSSSEEDDAPMGPRLIRKRSRPTLHTLICLYNRHQEHRYAIYLYSSSHYDPGVDDEGVREGGRREKITTFREQGKLAERWREVVGKLGVKVGG
jgi:hypothetical protein